jgi:hypothetical protein
MKVVVPEDISKRAENFVGREWVLDEVADWMDQGTERFLFITGQPGSGKTALAARLVGAGTSAQGVDANGKLSRVHDKWQAAHFCMARGQNGTLNPVRFAQSLARQLSGRYIEYAVAALHRIAPEINIHLEARQNYGNLIGAQIETLVVGSNALDMYNHVVREALEELFRSRPSLRVFILVDALDEALTFDDRTNIVTLLAGSDDLPAGVRFLLTSRNEPRVLDQFDQARRIDLSDPEHAHEADIDIRAYVEQRLAEERVRRRLQTVESLGVIAETLVRRAAGNFLYVEFLLDEVADGKRSAEELKGLPQGLYGLYRRSLDAPDVTNQCQREMDTAIPAAVGHP